MGGKKNFVCCCLHHLVVLYLDSLEVDEAIEPASVCPIRAAAWTNQLIQAVMQKDRKPNGEFGKLRFKEGVGATIRDGLFVGMTQTEHFVSSKLPATFPDEKKRKLTALLGDLCKDISTRLGTFVEEYGSLDCDEPSGSHVQNTRIKRQRTDGVDEDDEDVDDEWNAESDSEEDNDDNDDDEQFDSEPVIGGSTSHMTHMPDGIDDEEGEQDCDLQPRPRRSHRLAKDSPMKQASQPLEINGSRKDDSSVHAGEANLGGNTSPTTHEAGGRNRGGGEQSCLQEPRKSPRLAKNNPMKRQEEVISHGASREATRVEDDVRDEGGGDDVVLNCILRSERRDMQKVQAENKGNSATTEEQSSFVQRSPFSELKEYVLQDLGKGNEGIDMPHIEPFEFFDTPLKYHANMIFMQQLERTPQSTPPVDQFRRDFAIRQCVEECYKLKNKKIIGDNTAEDRVRQKMVGHRGRPDDSISAAGLHKGSAATADVNGGMNDAVFLGEPRATTASLTATNLTQPSTMPNFPATSVEQSTVHPKQTTASRLDEKASAIPTAQTSSGVGVTSPSIRYSDHCC